MFRFLVCAAAVAALVPAARAADAIPLEAVEAVKKAAVFVRVEGDGWSGSGSGFVVAGNGPTLLIATNHHVIAPPAGMKGNPTVTVVFDSGTKAERSYPATVTGDDAERDLAVLRATAVKDPPKPLAAADTPKLTETMTVYSFGFPFGKALAVDQGLPAVTVGKASISSLRNGPDGELAVIQIDGNLNPGNSGGPVVDAKGQLVGVAVATIKDSQGIGFVIPVGELGQMMRGRVGRVRIVAPKKDGPATARVEVQLLDPTGSVRGATVRYAVLPAGVKRPDSLDKLPDAKSVALKIESGTAVADLPIAATDGELALQISLTAAGKSAVAEKVRTFPLTDLADVSGPPPTGWKEYTPRDRSFTMWVPEKPASQSDQEKVTPIGNQRIRVNSVVGRTAGGLVYEGQSVLLPVSAVRASRSELYDAFSSGLATDFKGRVTEKREVTSGRLSGFEYRIEAAGVFARARIFVFGPRVLVVIVAGSEKVVASADAERLLAAFRMAEFQPPPPAFAEVTGAGGAVPTVFGAASGTAFKDAGPKDGLLVGFEVVVGKAGDRDAIASAMPLYRVGKTDSFGQQFGPGGDDPVTVKAKPGYAVGGMLVKSGDRCNGFALLFFKVIDGGRLEPADSYQSEWVGWNGPVQPMRLTGNGTPVIGVVGRTAGAEVAGLGLLFRGQEKADPAAAIAPVVAKGPVAPPPLPSNPPQPRGKEPVILGGAFDPVFVEPAPGGGLLVGLEVGTAKAFGTMMTRSVRPIYRTGDKETFGTQRGTQLDNVVTLKAKPGYAVGAVSVMHGLGFDGISVTFMKVTDGKLDPADNYESQYVGSDQKKPLTKIGGDGTPVIGIVGKSNAKDLTGFGLLFRDQEDYKPKK